MKFAKRKSGESPLGTNLDLSNHTLHQYANQAKGDFENPATHADPRNFYRRCYLPKVKDLGLTGVTWHTLRHTFASRLAMAGVTEGTIASLLRHSGTALVRRYAHLCPSYLQGAVEKVSAFGKVKTTEPMKVGVSEATGTEGMMERTEKVEALSVVPTGTKSVSVEKPIEAL